MLELLFHVQVGAFMEAYPPEVDFLVNLVLMFHVTKRRFIVLSESQGGFRWGADALVGSLVKCPDDARLHTHVCGLCRRREGFGYLVGGSDAGPIA